MDQPEFVPQNELEQALLDAQNGRCTVPEFFGALLRAQVYLLLDKEVDPGGQWDATLNPCVLSNSTGSPVLAAFTAPERATGWTERLPRFAHGLLVSFPWVLLRLGPKIGLVLNPEGRVGVEIGSDTLAQLKARIMASQGQAPAPGWDVAGVPKGRLN